MIHALEARRMLALTIVNSGGNVTVNGTAGNDVIMVVGSSVYDGWANYENNRPTVDLEKIAGLKAVAVKGNDGNDVIEYDTGYLRVPISAFGQNGNDSISAWKAGWTVIDGGAGDDQLAEAFTLIGGDGNDKLYYGYNKMDGGTGNDTLTGGVSEDSGAPRDQTIIGGDGNDSIDSDGGVDFIDAGNGNDTIRTSIHESNYEFNPNMVSTVKAGAGADKVYLASSAVVYLGADDDRAYFDQPDAYYYPQKEKLFGEVFGEGGKDWIQVKDTVTLLNGKQFKLHGGVGNDTIIGSKGNDLLDGDDGNDIIYGNYGNDTLNGGIGNDTLDGDQGNDKLYGGDGNDSLIGDLGNDSLYGQLGIDTLVAKDGNKDYLSGGASTDIYSKDSIDTVID